MNDRQVNFSYDTRTPCRRWNYCATFEDYEPGDFIGYGATEEEAEAELRERAGESVSS